MLQKQSNLLTTVRGLLLVMNQDRQHWEGIQQICSCYDSIDLNLHNASIIAQEIEGIDSTINTTILNDRFNTGVDLTLLLCKKLQIFGLQTKNTQITLSTKYSRSSLTKGTREKVLNRIVSITNIAKSHIQQLSEYQVTTNELTQINQSVIECIRMEGERTVLQSTRAIKHQELENVIIEIRQDLSLLDNMVEVYINDAQTVARYKNARSIKKYGHLKTIKKNGNN